MRAEYDFTESRKNPYTKRLKRQVTMRIDGTTIDYFKQLAAGLGIPYQNLINLFLRDCAERKQQPAIQWSPVEPKASVRRRSKLQGNANR